ncbi:MAG: GatB/YqeY domain-containing protein [Patescibacteria group bacterium]|nr:GatB/YqeY domain-containing protein [Patescibacteria group bacterium]MDE1940786.1 GatB/YqeY domain-containing protein [Patescibacteria group bacterium]MDE1966645.1 GatB/YqeY domain-containing protein [Patescibacteria group bacterium]
MLHKDIKEQIKEAMRAKDQLKLDTLRGLNAMFQNEMIASKLVTDFLPDDKSMPLVKRAVKQRKDSIEQFEKGGRADLADKEKKELAILEAFLPKSMSREEIAKIAKPKVDELKKSGAIGASPMPAAVGKLTGMVMKELGGKADGADVKAVIEELLK